MFSLFQKKINVYIAALKRRINDPSSPGKQAVLDTAADLQARQKSELDRDRGSYISKLVIERRTEAERKRIQLEAVRYRQFLGDESNGDRLRLDVLASKLQLARQALSSVSCMSLDRLCTILSSKRSHF